MHINIIAFAVPLFIGLMLLEFWVAKKRNKNSLFNLHNSIANISIGIGERIADLLVTGGFFFVYDYLHRHFAIFNIRSSWVNWVLLLLATDFLWYWYHRFGHEVNILWGAHVVHHQSEDYNFTVSARITVFQALARTCFWSVLPIIGFPPEMITVMLLLHGLYPFFIHTQLVGKLGVLEYVFVTPSHHRVHHCSNEQYLDKNYGDVLIIWDKLFGTFQVEVAEIEPVFGLTKPLDTYSFLWQHFHFFIELWLAAKSRRGIRAKLAIVFGKPDDVDPALRHKAERLFNIKHNKKEAITNHLNSYVVWQVVGLLCSLFVFVLFEKYCSVTVKIIFTIITLLTLINCGAIMEHKRWIFHVEYLRLIAFILIPVTFYNVFNLAGLAAFVLASIVLPVLYYQTLQEQYLWLVYRRTDADSYER